VAYSIPSAHRPPLRFFPCPRKDERSTTATAQGHKVNEPPKVKATKEARYGGPTASDNGSNPFQRIALLALPVLLYL
jgi:hypothetical protein